MPTLGFILGSAYGKRPWQGLDFEPLRVPTPFGEARVHRARLDGTRQVFVIYRHGVPHSLLPNQINFRANAWALHSLGCQVCVLTSSVGVLDATVPLSEVLLVDDLLMPDHRLPDGSLCTMWPTPTPGQGHLVLQDGLFSTELSEQALRVAGLSPQTRRVVFAYVAGPRTKTSAENAYWAALGAQVNSMSVGPEVVLANELEMPTIALVSGHKISRQRTSHPTSTQEVEASLDEARETMHAVIESLMHALEPVAFTNSIYRF